MGTVLAWELVAQGQHLEPAQGVLGAEGPHWAVVVAVAAAVAAAAVVVAVAAVVAAVAVGPTPEHEPSSSNGIGFLSALVALQPGLGWHAAA